jgi:hypothetical protein
MNFTQAHSTSKPRGCVRHDVGRWHERELTWKRKPFLKDHVRAFLHIPLNLESVILRSHDAIERAGAYPEERLWLMSDTTAWRSVVYVAVERDVPGHEIVHVSGTFLTRVFQGSLWELGEWIDEMNAWVSDRDGRVRKMYFYHLRCPNCSSSYASNRVVIFARVA